MQSTTKTIAWASGAAILTLMAAPGSNAQAQGLPLDYTAGHTDLAVEYDVGAGELEVFLEVEGATIGGAVVEEGEFDLADIRVITDAQFQRPVDGGAFSDLGVAVGDAVFWLPQTNGDASNLDVPFMGIANEVPSGVFVGDSIDLRLVAVSAPVGSGDFSLWRDGFPPAFSMTTEDGISAADVLSLPPGHDHYNLGFAPATSPGTWALTFEASGQLVGGGTRSTQFQLNVLTCDGDCPDDAVAAVPAGSSGQLLLLGLGILVAGGVGVVGRRRKHAGAARA